MKLAAAILTHNEGAFIAGCLDSLRAVTSDIILLDSHSTDRTPEIGREHGARVIVCEWHGFANARNTAMELARASDWLLFVDADERIPSGLAEEIHEAIETSPDSVDGYLIPRKNVICGRVMRGGGWWPDYQLRLLRPGRCRYPNDRAVHEAPICSGPTLALSTPLIHLNYRSWTEFARKQVDYARLAALADRPARPRAYLGAPSRLFWHRFIADRGYLDGLAGLFAATILAASEICRVWHSRRQTA